MNLKLIYFLGSKLQYLKRYSFIRPYVKGDGLLLENMQLLVYYLEELRLSPVSCSDLKKMIDRFDESYAENQELSSDDEESLIESIKLWNDRIKNELSARVVIEVFTDGSLNYDKIILGAKHFFPESVWSDLSAISKSDLNDACNCLLTRSWTPAVMIALRSSEDCIRHFYKSKTGANPGTLGWKKILDRLKDIPDINKTLIGYFDYIRDMRNTAEHPDEIFDQMEAERVFHQVVNMIVVIYKELAVKDVSLIEVGKPDSL